MAVVVVVVVVVVIVVTVVVVVAVVVVVVVVMGPIKNTMKSLYHFPKSAHIHVTFLLHNFGEFIGNFGCRPIPLVS